MDWKAPENSCNFTKVLIPFSTVDDLSCTEENCYKYRTFEEIDEYQNLTTYKLMEMDIAAEHNKNGTKLG